MSDPTNPNIEKRSTPQWALYQREQFWKVNDGVTPPFNTRKLTYYLFGMNIHQDQS